MFLEVKCCFISIAESVAADPEEAPIMKTKKGKFGWSPNSFFLITGASA
jgi:hypothetical protein